MREKNNEQQYKKAVSIIMSHVIRQLLRDRVSGTPPPPGIRRSPTRRKTNVAGLPRGCKRNEEIKTRFTYCFCHFAPAHWQKNLPVTFFRIPFPRQRKIIQHLQHSEIISDIKYGLTSVPAWMERIFFLSGTVGGVW